jgi:hypothetical protein
VLDGNASRVELTLTSGQRDRVINQLRGAPAGQWTGPDGTVLAMALHNCWVPASWFFPALALAEPLSDASVSISFVGQETRSGASVDHIKFWRTFPSGSGSAGTRRLLEHLSAVDVYLDAADLAMAAYPARVGGIV